LKLREDCCEDLELDIGFRDNIVIFPKACDKHHILVLECKHKFVKLDLRELPATESDILNLAWQARSPNTTGDFSRSVPPGTKLQHPRVFYHAIIVYLESPKHRLAENSQRSGHGSQLLTISLLTRPQSPSPTTPHPNPNSSTSQTLKLVPGRSKTPHPPLFLQCPTDHHQAPHP
jgi:hypothetical protein